MYRLATLNNYGIVKYIISMKKIKQEEGKSFNIVADNIDRLKVLFPEAVSESGAGEQKVDFDVLRQLLGDDKVLNEGEEKYGLNWHGKKKARQMALAPSTGTLRPCPEESVDWDTTQNLFIEGDNLEVLKLLQKSYANKIKMIYIDPPYNTGKEFIYPDRYQDNLRTYLKFTGQMDDQGLRTGSNRESSGRYHTNWLSMMYPRLKLVKNLLQDDGVLFISIDDNESANLKVICDEVFGRVNHLVTFYIQVRYPGKTLSEKNSYQKLIEQVHVYQKSGHHQPVRETEEYSLEKFCWQINELAPGKKIWLGGREVEIFKPGEYEIHKVPSSIEMLKETWASGSVLKVNASGKYFGNYLASRKNKDGLGVLYKVDKIGKDGLGYRYFTGPKKENATKGKFYSGVPTERKREIKEGVSLKEKPILNFYNFADAFGNCRHEGGVDFRSGKKPVDFLKTLVSQATQNDDSIFLDFFCGSASLAHAVLEKNKEDYGKRRFIMVQLPEEIDERDKNPGDSFENIADIGKERIRRAGQKILEQAPEYAGDTGFRVFKLDSSNIRAWNPDRSDLEESLLSHQEHLVEGRTDQDLLYELLLKRGVDLSVPIENREVAGKTIYSVGYGALFACLAESITRGQVEVIAQAIVEWHKELAPDSYTHIFFRDSAFNDDIAKTNLVAILEQNGISHVRSL